MAQGDMQDPNDPLVVLNNELQSQATIFSQESEQRQANARQISDQLDTNQQLAQVLDSVVITNETINRRNKAVLTVPPGAKFTAQSGKGQNNIDVAVDPTTGETIIYNTRAPLDPDKTARAVVQSAGISVNNKNGPTFDLQSALDQTKTLQGDALLDHISTTMVNIDLQIANEMKRIRQTAGIESGYSAARAAVDRNVMLDQTTGFAQRFGHASAQTILSQQQAAQALGVSQTLMRGLMAEDSEIARLHSAKQTLGKLEAQRAQKQIQQENIAQNRKEKREEQEQAISEMVTEQELANYKYVYGTSKDDLIDKRTIALRRDKDKVLGKLISANSTSIYELLMDQDPLVSNGALKLSLAYEKANNKDIPKDAKTTPRQEFIEKATKDPVKYLLTPEIVKDKERLTQLLNKQRNATGNDLKEFRLHTFPDLLARYVETEMEKRFTEDMGTWRAPNIKLEGPLQTVLKEVSKISPEGKAPIGMVVESFISNKYKTPDGKELGFNDKMAILEQTIKDSVGSLDRDLTISNDAMTALQNRMTNSVKNIAARAHIRSNPLLFGMHPGPGWEK